MNNINTTTNQSQEKKEVILWEESKNTIPPKKSDSQPIDGEWHITSGTNEKKEEKLSTDTIRKRPFTTNTSGVYKITNEINGKYYIGKSTKIGRRWSEHRRFLRQNRHDTPHLQNAWNKYGENSFKFEILERDIPISNLRVTEQKYLDIAKLDRINAYNTNFIADSGMFGENHPNYKLVPENIKNKAKEIWMYQTSEEFVNYLLSNGYGAKVKGRILKEFKQDEIANKIKDETYRKNMSISTSGERNGNWGNHQSEETKIKVRLRRKEYITTPETRLKMAISRRDKTIYRFKNNLTNELFEGIKYDFYTKHKLYPSWVNSIISGKSKKTGENWIFLGEVIQ
jgi:group I intron endonuclease